MSRKAERGLHASEITYRHPSNRTGPNLASGVVSALAILALFGAPAFAQSTGQNQSSQQNQTSATQQNTAPTENTKITSGRDLENLQYDLKNRSAFLDSAQTNAPIDAAALARGFGVGVSLLSKDDPYWSGGKSTVAIGVLRKIRDAGFSTVRIPVSASLNAAGQLDEAYVKRLDALVNAALNAHLLIILVESDDDKCAAETKVCATLLPTVWNFLAQHYQDAPSALSFELLNAPSGAVNSEIWNAWIPGLVSIIRESNPTRNIIVDSAEGGSAVTLGKLTLSADPHLIGGFQLLPTEGTDVAKSNLVAAAAWTASTHKQVLITRFGPATTDSGWTADVTQMAAEAGLSRVYAILNGSEAEGGLMDPEKRNWNQAIKQAVLPK